MKYLRNLTDQRLMIQDLKIQVRPNSVSQGLTEDDIKNSKDVQLFKAKGKLEIANISDEEANEIRKKDSEDHKKRIQQINNAYLKNVSSKKPRSRNAASSKGFQDQVMNGVNNSVAPPGAGSVANGSGQPQSIDSMAKNSQKQLQEVAQKVESAKQKKKVEKEEEDKKAEAKKQEKEEIQGKDYEDDVSVKQDKKTSESNSKEKDYKDDATIDNEESGENDLDSKLQEFHSLPFFTKKSRINKLEDKEFIKKLLESEDNDTVISLLNQKLEELE